MFTESFKVFDPASPRKLKTVWRVDDDKPFPPSETDSAFMSRMERRYPGKKFVGFWRSSKDSVSDLPWPHDTIDESQPEELLNVVADYLDDKRFFDIQNGWMGVSNCRICGKRLGSVDCVDSKWVWPDGLGHYVRDHKIRLPDQFVTHILLETGRRVIDKL